MGGQARPRERREGPFLWGYQGVRPAPAGQRCFPPGTEDVSRSPRVCACPRLGQGEGFSGAAVSPPGGEVCAPARTQAPREHPDSSLEKSGLRAVSRGEGKEMK